MVLEKLLPAGRLAWLGCAKRERVRGAIARCCKVKGPNSTEEKNILRLVAFIRESPQSGDQLFYAARRTSSVGLRGEEAITKERPEDVIFVNLARAHFFPSPLHSSISDDLPLPWRQLRCADISRRV
jgi:hypothetical protein